MLLHYPAVSHRSSDGGPFGETLNVRCKHQPDFVGHSHSPTVLHSYIACGKAYYK